MAAKKAKKPVKKSIDWSKVFVFSGEPLQVQMGVDAAIKSVETPPVTRFTKDDSPKTIFSTLTKFQLEEPSDIVWLNFPTADQLKTCMEVLEAQSITASILIISTPGDSLDGRSAFAMAANKNKRVWMFEYIQAGDSHALEAHLKDWEKGMEMKINPDAKSWLVKKAPTYAVKIKTATGKKEAEAYDLLDLEAELEKIAIVRQYEGGSISLDDVVNFCFFNYAQDVWGFVAAATVGDKALIMRHLDQMDVGKTDQGSLWLLISQLGFLISVRSLMDLGIQDTFELQRLIPSDRYIGRYLLPDWTEAEARPAATVNPYRIQKAMESVYGITSAQLGAKYAAVMSGIRDLRAGLHPEIVIPYLTLALAGSIDYSSPLADRF